MGAKIPEKKIKFSFWYVSIALLALTLVRGLIGGLLAQSGTEISYSEFKRNLRSNQVVSVRVGEDRITGILKDESVFTTIPVNDPGLIEELDSAGIDVSGEPASTGGISTILGWILPMVLMAGLWYWLLKRLRGGMGGSSSKLFSFGKSKARIVQGEDTGVTFKDVGGLGEALTDLREVTEFLKNPESFQRLGGKMPKGVLLVGPPGTGKTLMARAAAGEAGVPFFSLSGAEFVEMFVGVGASRVRDLFEQAKKRAPSIIFIDEIDAIGGRRAGAGALVSNEEREQTLNQLLAEMDGFAPTAGLILLAATNRPEILDPALLRPGRFDRQIAVGLPDLIGREEILSIHTRQVILSDETDIKSIARITPGLSGADLANVANEAALLASRRGKDSVESVDFDEAIERTLTGSERHGRAMNSKEKETVAVHEAGHAIVAALLPGTDPVHKVSIVPRGKALGYTWQRPTEDRYLLSEGELRNRLAVLLGGRVAESMMVGQVSTGATDDLTRATDLARRMVTEYGMSAELGPLRLALESGAAYLGSSAAQDYRNSPETAATIDREIRRLVVDATHEAEALLSANKEQVTLLADELSERETVSGDRLAQILGTGDQTGVSQTPA